MRKVIIDERFNVKNTEPNVLYIRKITEHHGDNNQQIHKQFFSNKTKLNEDYDYICNIRFITSDKDVKTSLKKLQQGIKEYLNETGKELTTGNITDNEIEELSKNIGTLTDNFNNETSYQLTIICLNNRCYSVYDTII